MDVESLKARAAGRWSEILQTLGGISADLLDGRHHGCPRCGGKDRFRLLDGDTGALFCNQCFNEKNGDGIAALQWLTGDDFSTTARRLGEYLGNGNGQSRQNGKPKPRPLTGKVFPTAQAAIADLERQHGKRSMQWTYHDSRGEPVGVIVRWDKSGGKEIRPVSRNGSGWTLGGMPEPRPLYNLPALADARRVYVCEGEKAAEAARRINLTATTSPHGSQSAHKADWTPLAGKEICILPDADTAGKKYTDEVTAILCKLKPAPVVKVVNLPDLPDGGDIFDYLEIHDAVDGGDLRQQIDRMADAARPVETGPRFTRLLSCSDLLSLDLKPRFLVRGVMVDGQPLIVGGRSKTLKTSITCDLVLSLGSGTPFLGRFETQQAAVGFWSGESGASVIRETAQRVAVAKGIDLAGCSVWWSFDLPKLSRADHLEALADVIKERALRVVIVDPLYLALLSPETAGGASNLYAMGAALEPLSKLAQDNGTTLVVLHHFRKGGQADDLDPCGLDELAQSGASEWARQWILLQRRASYQGDGEHLLWMRCGGSAGHSSLWGVTIDEGQIDLDTLAGRRWDVTVSPAADAREETEREKESRRAAKLEQQEGEHRDRLLAVIRKMPDGDTARVLRGLARLNSENFDRAMFALLQEGRAIRCTITKNGVGHDAYKPTGK